MKSRVGAASTTTTAASTTSIAIIIIGKNSSIDDTNVDSNLGPPRPAARGGGILIPDVSIRFKRRQRDFGTRNRRGRHRAGWPTMYILTLVIPVSYVIGALRKNSSCRFADEFLTDLSYSSFVDIGTLSEQYPTNGSSRWGKEQEQPAE